MFNLMIAVGRITDKPVLRQTNSGRYVANFTIALNRITRNSDDKETDFFDVIVWNTPAQNCEKYLKKGSLVLVQGKMQKRKFKDTNGDNRTVVELLADNIQFLEPLRRRKKADEEIEVESTIIEDEIELPFED